MTEHPAQQFAAQAAEAAEALQEFLNPLRDFNYPGVDNWPRELTSNETADLLRQVHAAIIDLGTCVEAIAGKAAYEGPPRQHLPSVIERPENRGRQSSMSDLSMSDLSFAKRASPPAKGRDPGRGRMEDILISGELRSRPHRAPNLEGESEALRILARVMANSPRQLPDTLLRLALELCRAGSAGISGATIFTALPLACEIQFGAW